MTEVCWLAGPGGRTGAVAGEPEPLRKTTKWAASALFPGKVYAAQAV